MTDPTALAPPRPSPDPRVGPPAMPEPGEVARRLGISEEAARLARDCEVVDLHVDTFIPPRLWGYDPLRRHGAALAGRWFFGHLDLYRIFEGGLGGAMWSITTNPIRGRRGRWRAFQRNLAGLRALVDRSGGWMRVARDATEYREARAAGAHAVLISVQGGNALDGAPEGAASIPDDAVVRVTLVHLTDSGLGATSSPLGLLRRDKRLTPAGRDLVRRLDERRIFVDLAHAHERTFWDAVDAHDRSLPLVATHTGVVGARPHWRNLDDRQLKAIADTGGTIGIIFSAQFLRRQGGPRDGRMVVEHMEHVIRIAGEDSVSVGSDYDGAITPPRDLRGGECYPRLVQHMLDAGWGHERIAKVLGGNFLRCLAALRPGRGGR